MAAGLAKISNHLGHRAGEGGTTVGTGSREGAGA